MSPRFAAVQVLNQVLQTGQTLPTVLAEVSSKLPQASQRALVQEICYGVLRWLPRLDFILDALLQKPIKAKDMELRPLLLVGLYQLIYMRVPDHAAVSESVAVTKKLGKPWARGLVNAVLRNYQRRAEELNKLADDNPSAHFAHPPWWLQRLQTDWPTHWQAIVTANNQPPPMTLRVNAHQTSRDAYLQQLRQADLQAEPTPHTTEGITLTEAVPVEALPNFQTGAVSVQDGAAQLAAPLLNAQAGERILDACAAPGGKTAHILESQPKLAMLTAIDKAPHRLTPLRENLQRLRLENNTHIQLITADASDPEAWWDGVQFDRILLDAPCSASGIIRRHPDIKVLRRPSDIDSLAKTQRDLLCALWPLLKSGGMMLYATCSVLPQENTQLIMSFLAAQPDAKLQAMNPAWGHDTEAGQQILPGEDGMDGFYYACLIKSQS